MLICEVKMGGYDERLLCEGDMLGYPCVFYLVFTRRTVLYVDAIRIFLKMSLPCSICVWIGESVMYTDQLIL